MAAHAHLHIEGSMDAIALLLMVLHIAEVSAAIMLAGQLFFRVLIWKRSARSLPALLSDRGERMLAVLTLVLFILVGVIQGNMVWIRPALAGLWLVLSYMTETHRWDYPKIMKVIVASLLLLTFPFTERAVEAETPWLLLNLFLFMHLLTSAIWFGALVGVYKVTSSKTSPRLEFQELHSMITRLYNVSLLVILIIAGSGIALSVMRVHAWNQLFFTPYGQLLIIKSLLLLISTALMIFYRQQGLQRLRGAAASGEAALKKVQRQINNRVRFEMSIIVLLVIFSGILASVSLPEVAAKGKPIFWHEMGQEAHMTFFMKHETLTEQSYRVDVWLRAGSGAPTELNVELISRAGHISIPFIFRQGGPDPHGFEGFDKYTYDAYGSYWNDSADPVTVRIKFVDAQNHPFFYENIFER